MASPINTSALTGSSLNVKDIVNQLMQVERAPISALQARLDTSGVRITALGSLQSRMSALQDAVDVLQTPALFKRFSASTSDTNVLAVAAGDDAAAGSYDVQVTALASASRFALLPPAGPTQYELGLNVEGQARTFSFSASTLTELQTLISQEGDLNGLASVNLIDGRRGFLQGLRTGDEQAITLSINGQRDDPFYTPFGAQSPELKPGYAVASDARLVIAGMDVQNAENRFEVLGLDLDLAQTGSTRITVRRERVDASPAIDNLMTAYNQMLAEYKQQTASSVEAAERGVLNSDSTLAGTLQQINQYLRGRFSDAQGPNQGLSDLGLEFARDGQLVRMAQPTVTAAQLSDRLAGGFLMGTARGQDLSSFIADALTYGGMLTERVEAEKKLQRDLLDRQSLLEEKMLEIERRYTSQYAALDALLFRLNTTSTALKSALDALTNSMKND